MLCDGLVGWDGRGRSKREGMCVCIRLIHFAVQQKLTHNIVKQLCSNKKKKKRNTYNHLITKKEWIKQVILHLNDTDPL